MTVRYCIRASNEYHKSRSLRVDEGDWLNVIIPGCGKDVSMNPQTLLDAYDLWSKYKAGEIAVMTKGEYLYAIECVKGDSAFMRSVLDK